MSRRQSENAAGADFQGARASNAGDDFHELWALRQALALLGSRDSNLTEVAVEGLRVEDERRVPLEAWAGVDCTLYFGGDDNHDPDAIIVDRVKYSSADPDKAWTVSRLCAACNAKKDNSVTARLAKVYAGLAHKFPSLATRNAIKVRLVSNQQIGQGVLAALRDVAPLNASHRVAKGEAND